MDALKEFLDKFKEMFGEMDKTKKMAAAGGAGLLLLVVMFLSFSGGDSSDVQYLPLYTEIDMKEAGRVRAVR